MIDYLNKLFNVDNNITVPILISLIVFITGGLFKFLFQLINTYVERNSIRRTFKVLLKRTSIELNKKELTLLKLFETLNIESGGGWKFSHINLSYLETFYDLEFKQIYNAFRIKFQWRILRRESLDESFHKTWSLLRNLKFVEQRIEDSFKTMIDKFNHYQNSYNTSIENYRQKFGELRTYTSGQEITLPEVEFFEGLNAILVEWQKVDAGERIKPDITYHHIVVPTLDFCRKYQDSKMIIDIDKLLTSCTYDYDNMKHLLEVYNHQFRYYYYFYRTSRRLFNVIIEKI